MVQKAQARQEDVQREIDGLRMKRREAESSLESIIAALHNTIDFIREQEQREQRTRPAAPGGARFRSRGRQGHGAPCP